MFDETIVFSLGKKMNLINYPDPPAVLHQLSSLAVFLLESSNTSDPEVKNTDVRNE